MDKNSSNEKLVSDLLRVHAPTAEARKKNIEVFSDTFHYAKTIGKFALKYSGEVSSALEKFCKKGLAEGITIDAMCDSIDMALAGKATLFFEPINKVFATKGAAAWRAATTSVESMTQFYADNGLLDTFSPHDWAPVIETWNAKLAAKDRVPSIEKMRIKDGISLSFLGIIAKSVQTVVEAPIVVDIVELLSQRLNI